MLISLYFIASTALASSSRPESRLFQTAKRAFITATNDIKAQRYASAERTLDALWRAYPPGARIWEQSSHLMAGLNYGSPPFYYALRMMTDVVNWRRDQPAPKANVEELVLRVVLIGGAVGMQPRSPGELSRGQGVVRRHRLHPSLRNDRKIFEESLWLMREYVNFITDGRSRLTAKILDLPKVTVPVRVATKPLLLAGLDYDKAWPVIWHAIPDAVKATSNWWWILYPSHVPPKSTGFANSDFITGGMGAGLRGEPAFLIDDLWLVRKPPHLGTGDYSVLERQAYLPQWLQHEFFHHLFRNYPEFGLEAESHQWFDCKTWPKDFVGRMEPDYYHQALHKRLLGAQPPLHVTLRHPPGRVFAPAYKPVPTSLEISLSDVLGTYRRTPVANDWHVGEIASGPANRDLIWHNKAGRSWRLKADLSNGMLVTGPDNPYYASQPVPARDFTLIYKANAGNGGAKIIGFKFQGELYRKD